jgi:pyruvate kinase
MGERAECVMLNKGPYAVTSVSVLADILRRMQDHQEKKTLDVAVTSPRHLPDCRLRTRSCWTAEQDMPEEKLAIG